MTPAQERGAYRQDRGWFWMQPHPDKSHRHRAVCCFTIVISEPLWDLQGKQRQDFPSDKFNNVEVSPDSSLWPLWLTPPNRQINAAHIHTHTHTQAPALTEITTACLDAVCVLSSVNLSLTSWGFRHTRSIPGHVKQSHAKASPRGAFEGIPG